MSGRDLDQGFVARRAIDCHVHITRGPATADDATRRFEAGAQEVFGRGGPATVDDVAAYYRERDIGCVVFAVDSESTTGRVAVPSEYIADRAAEHADVMVPFGSVDPWGGEVSRRRIQRLVTDHGVRGFKFHPSTQAFQPDDRRFYPLYDAIAEAGVPVVFHTGQTGMGAKLPGGGGIRLRYSNPMFLDDVAVDFPELMIIMAHPSVPWQDEGLAVALHKPNVYMDLSGWSPKYFEPKLVTYVKKLLADKVLFGSDFPLITPERWLDDFDTLEVGEQVARKVLRENALELLAPPTTT